MPSEDSNHPYLTPIHIHCLELYTFDWSNPPVQGGYSHQIYCDKPAYCTPGGTRTLDPLIKSQLLWPTELQAHLCIWWDSNSHSLHPFRLYWLLILVVAHPICFTYTFDGPQGIEPHCSVLLNQAASMTSTTMPGPILCGKRDSNSHPISGIGFLGRRGYHYATST